MARSTFSDSWHQVAALRVGLLPTVRVHKQRYRNQLWYVLQDSCSDKYFRLRPEAWAFVGRLTPRRTVAESWERFCETHPEQAPGQEDVVALLAQLHQMNLLFFRAKGESEGIFARYQKTKRKEKLSYLMAFLYFRIPIWDPDQLLKAHLAWMGGLFSPMAVLVWCVTLALGARAVLENIDRLQSAGAGILAVDNLMWLFVALFVLKFLHEMGHAIACRRYGAPVHTIGLMMIAMMPLPYTDASSSWSLRSPWQRAVVAAAGMYVELFVAALSALVWASTGPSLVNGLAFNLMIIGSISSLVFNGNPLLKFDAYYILSDLTGLPNLYQRASQQWFYVLKRHYLRIHQALSPAEDLYERLWYLGYGLLSVAYRLLVMVVIVLYMADLSLILGVLIVLAMSYIWLIGPLVKLFTYLTRHGEIGHGRIRAIALTLFGFSVIGTALATLPMPNALRAPGVVEATERTELFSGAGGTLLSLRLESGVAVAEGELLVSLDNPALALERELVGQQIIEVRWLLRRAVDQSAADGEALRERERALLSRLDDIEARIAALSVVAPHAGLWIPALGPEALNTAIVRGARLGTVLNPEVKHFVGVVSQEQASTLFSDPLSGGEIRLHGNPGRIMAPRALQFLPFEQRELPSPALGIPGGGQIPAETDGQGRVRAIEPFFEVRAPLDPALSAEIQAGALGTIRIALEPRPPLVQAWLSLQQLVKRRYQL